MDRTQQRTKLRAFLTGSKCVTPASVYDPLSARIAQSVGFELGLLAGSVVSSTTLAAPDILVYTLTEYCDQIRRIMRASTLSIFVDADHGYGNALNVMRTVEELEHAGVAGLSIEDTAGPIAYEQPEGTHKLVSIEEAVGKMRAALAARCDPSLVIIGRTPALKREGLESAIARVRAYATAGVDAIHLAGGADTLEQVQAIHAAAKLPLILGPGKGLFERDALAACGARILLPRHLPVPIAVKALYETYTHLFNGAAPADLESRVASAQQMDELVSNRSYQQWLGDYTR